MTIKISNLSSHVNQMQTYSYLITCIVFMKAKGFQAFTHMNTTLLYSKQS